MIKGKSILSYLFILLFLLLSNLQRVHSSVSLPISRYNKVINIAPKNAETGAAFITSHTIHKDKIRIRYVAGECAYDAVSLPLNLTVPEYTDHVPGATYTSFLFSTSHFSFTLRGPPAIA